MPCIFGFRLHDFCPCDLLTTDESHLVNVVCSNCEHRLRCLYKAFLNEKEANAGWDGTFDDFVEMRIDYRLNDIRATYPESCGYGLTSKESEIVNAKLGKICDQFMTY